MNERYFFMLNILNYTHAHTHTLKTRRITDTIRHKKELIVDM